MGVGADKVLEEPETTATLVTVVGASIDEVEFDVGVTTTTVVEAEEAAEVDAMATQFDKTASHSLTTSSDVMHWENLVEHEAGRPDGSEGTAGGARVCGAEEDVAVDRQLLSTASHWLVAASVWMHEA